MDGFGNHNFSLGIHIANRPPLDRYATLDSLMPLARGEIDYIVSNSSNHWRKVFNVYAKLLQELEWTDDWRTYRDQQLLQPHCSAALLFNAPQRATNKNQIRVIAGKAYAQHLKADVDWIDTQFALNTEKKLVVCPYLDYRQLSNERIATLARLIRSLS